MCNNWVGWLRVVVLGVGRAMRAWECMVVVVGRYKGGCVVVVVEVIGW